MPLLNTMSPESVRHGASQPRSHRTSIPGLLLYLLQWLGYPVAMYNIASCERSIAATVFLRKGLMAMELEVRNGIDAQSIDCLRAGIWDHIPWEAAEE